MQRIHFNVPKHIFHRHTRKTYLYNGCLAWYNVVITSRVHSSMKSQFRKVRQFLKYTAAVSCDDGISVLNHCLSWSKFVSTHLSHSQWINIHILSKTVLYSLCPMVGCLKSRSMFNMRYCPCYFCLTVTINTVH